MPDRTCGVAGVAGTSGPDSIGGMRVERIVDLSHPISPRIQVYPGDPEPVFTPHATVAADGFALLHVAMGSQTGTHVDAPCHVLGAGESVDRLDPALFVGRGVVLDGRVGERERIVPDVWESVAIGPGDVALVHTGWSRYFGTDRYFAHPALSIEACAWLLERGVRAVGIDAPSIDPTGDTDLAAHRVFAGSGGVICENLCNLDAIDFPDPLVSFLPVPLAGADGAPVRAVALQVRE